MEEKVDNRRAFLGPDSEITYYIAAPTAEHIKEADWTYSKTYTRSLVDGGITTASEMIDILTRRGVIGPEFEKRSTELAQELGRKLLKLEQSDDLTMEEKQDAAIEVASAREDLFQWNQRLNGPMSNTCEQMADDARLEYLTSCMVQNEDGSRVWKSYDEFLKTKNQNLALRARFETMLYFQGLDSDFMQKTPEAVAIREVEEELLAKAQSAIDAAKAVMAEAEEDKAAEEAANVVESEAKDGDEEAKPVKKRVAKPKK